MEQFFSVFVEENRKSCDILVPHYALSIFEDSSVVLSGLMIDCMVSLNQLLCKLILD